MLRYRTVLLTGLLALASCTKLVDTDNTVVATVGREKIRLGDVLERISRSAPERRLAANTAEGRSKILEDLINEALLLQVADAQGIGVTDAEAQQRIQDERSVVRRTGGVGGQETFVQAARDPKTTARLLRMEKLVAPYVNAEAVNARYAQMVAGPAQMTVQYEFVSVRAANAAFAMDLERAMQAGAAAPELANKYRGHPDFVNGGRTQPILIRLLAPWLQVELLQRKPGNMLPPWQTQTAGEPTVQLIRLLNLWSYPPLDAIRVVLVDQLYEEYLDELKAAHSIERFPERLSLIDRR